MCIDVKTKYNLIMFLKEFLLSVEENNIENYIDIESGLCYNVLIQTGINEMELFKRTYKQLGFMANYPIKDKTVDLSALCQYLSCSLYTDKQLELRVDLVKKVIDKLTNV